MEGRQRKSEACVGARGVELEEFLDGLGDVLALNAGGRAQITLDDLAQSAAVQLGGRFDEFRHRGQQGDVTAGGLEEPLQPVKRDDGGAGLSRRQEGDFCEPLAKSRATASAWRLASPQVRKVCIRRRPETCHATR